MKTPDEIKKALECCFYDSEQCGECPYYPISCDRELVRDAREYIRQLEGCLDKEGEQNRLLWDKNKQLEERNESLQRLRDSMLDLNGKLHRDMLEQRERADKIEAERDAAVEDLETVCGMCSVCCACKDRFEGGKACRGCVNSSHWHWRGVTKEE